MENKPTILNFTVCPNCGSERFQANEVLKQQIEKGAMPKGSNAFLFNHQSVIAKPNFISAPVVLSFYDMCMDCGTVFCVHSEVHTAVVGGKTPQAGNQFMAN